MVVVAFLALTATAGAQERWYSGNNRSDRWGVQANILWSDSVVPSGEMFCAWVSTDSILDLGQYRWFQQCGLRDDYYAPRNYNPYSYYEWFDSDGNYSLVRLSEQAMHYPRNYRVQFVINRQWDIYIQNGTARQRGYSYSEGEKYMEALAECLEWPNGSVVVTYKHRDVQYRNANGTWSSFDQQQWMEDGDWVVTPIGGHLYEYDSELNH